MDSWKLSQRHKIPNCDYIRQNSIWKCFVRSYNELCKKITILSISFILWSITPPYLGVLRRVFARSEAEGGKPAFCVINQPMSKINGKLWKIAFCLCSKWKKVKKKIIFFFQFFFIYFSIGLKKGFMEEKNLKKIWEFLIFFSIFCDCA